MKRSEILLAQKQASEALATAGIIITNEEREKLEVADFGLGKLASEGLQIVIYANNERQRVGVVRQSDLPGA